MSWDIKHLASKGISSGEYKKLFTLPVADRPAPLKRLYDTISARIKDGREANLREYRNYWAVDLAYEAPFNQTTPTLVQQFWSANSIDKKFTPEEMNAELAKWGLKEEDVFLRVDDVSTTKWIPNPPVFFKIIIPIVKAYVTMRLATIYNERDRSPLFPYTPLKQTDKNRVLCDIMTDIVDTISNWYGYPAYLRQAILQTLKYGVMLAFPREEWHCEKQVIGDDVVVQKEGLRYIMPHPTRMAFDLHHPAPTINTDSGCEWGLHWNVSRAGDVLDNRMYWNRKAITYGRNWMEQSLAGNYFTEVFPCNLRFPMPVESFASGTTKREDKAGYYSTNNRDSALFLTTMFWKLVPKKWGLGDYNYPVWHRFDVASDDTIIWAAPCAYNPIWFMGYDFDDQAAQASSLALEAIPWQDHIGNLMSQMILTAKQNLKDVTFYDTNMIDKTKIDSLKNYGENKYRSTIWIPFDSLKMQRSGVEYKQPFINPQFQYRNVQEMQGMLSVALNLMERVLQFSAAETGAAAAHYQSAKEIGVAAQSTSQRRMFTAAGVDDGIDAWKRQLADGAMAYLNNDVVAQVSSDIPDWEKHVEELGFKVKSKGKKKSLVAGKKTALRDIEGFSRSNLGPIQSQDPAMAQIIFQTIGVISQNEQLFAKVGTARIVKLLEQAAKLAGSPADFDLTSDTNEQSNDPALMKQLMPVLQKLQESTLQIVSEKIAQPAAQQISQQGQAIQAIEQTVQQLEGIYKLAASANDKAQVKIAETQQQMQIDSAKFQAEQSRLNAEFKAEQDRLQSEHAAQMARDAERAQLDAAIASQKSQTEVVLKQEESNAGIAIKKNEAKASSKKKESGE